MKFPFASHVLAGSLPAFAAIVIATLTATPALVGRAARTEPALTNAPKIDPSALALVQHANAVMFGLKSYQGECTITRAMASDATGKNRSEGHDVANLIAIKPNLMRYESHEDLSRYPMYGIRKGRKTVIGYIAPRNRVKVVCDGKTVREQHNYAYFSDHNAEPDNLTARVEAWGSFFSERQPIYLTDASHLLVECRKAGREKVAGILCDKVTAHWKTENDEGRTTWYIGPDSLLRRQVEWKQSFLGGIETTDTITRHVVVNFAIPDRAKVFSFPAPKGVIFNDPKNPRLPPHIYVSSDAEERG